MKYLKKNEVLEFLNCSVLISDKNMLKRVTELNISSLDDKTSMAEVHYIFSLPLQGFCRNTQTRSGFSSN